MNRDEAYELLTEYTKKDSLIKHGLAVEGIMREYAKKFGGNQDEWGIVGLIHDFDYEKYPTAEDHPYKGAEILRKKGISEEWINAILGHADYTKVPRDTMMAKTLFAVDELSGFIIGVALVRPSKKIEDVKLKSIKKKLKDKAFCAAVNREDIAKGADEIEIPLDEHIQFVLDAMKKNAQALGV